MQAWIVVLFCLGAALCNPTSKKPRSFMDVVKPRHTRIINGGNANPGQYRFMVSLKYKNGNRHFCGATILTPHWILTAAQCCIVSNGADVYAYYRSIYLNSGGLSVDVSQKFVHPDYDERNNWRNDICVMRLSKDIVIDADTALVDLPSQGAHFPPNTPVVYIGWGQTGSEQIPNRLQVSNSNVLSSDTCQARTGIPSFEGQICAYGQGQGMCSGDSGGPLLYNGIQVGITSFLFFPCGTSGLPDYFTRIANYIPWIQQIIAQQ